MEKAPGRELLQTWFTMDISQRLSLIENVVNLEKILFEIPFPASGSLYLRDTLDPSIRVTTFALNPAMRTADEFCIGPSTEELWWYLKRDGLNVNRGPCK